MKEEKTWTKKRFEVHHSGDKTTWYRLGMLGYPNLQDAKVAYEKAKKEFRYLRLVKVELNYELLETGTTAETGPEKRAKIVAQAQALFKDSPSVHVYEGSSISFGEKVEMSPSYVMVEARQDVLAGKAPKRINFPKDDAGKDEYIKLHKEWGTKAHNLDDILAEEIKKRLTAAGISFRHGRQYGWNVFRLA